MSKKLLEGKRCGILFNKGAWWLGCHYSKTNSRWCINLIPMVTFWVIKPCGKKPRYC